MSRLPISKQYDIFTNYYYRCPPDIKDLYDLTREERSLLSTYKLNFLKTYNVPKAILDLESSYKLYELKEKAKKNYVDIFNISGNKTRKRTWAKEILKTTKWGFNTFIIGVKKDKKHILNSQIDILLMIQDYI